MKVYLCYQCGYYGKGRVVNMVTADESKAVTWVEEFTATEYDWREYEAAEVK